MLKTCENNDSVIPESVKPGTQRGFMVVIAAIVGVSLACHIIGFSHPQSETSFFGSHPMSFWHIMSHFALMIVLGLSIYYVWKRGLWRTQEPTPQPKGWYWKLSSQGQVRATPRFCDPAMDPYPQPRLTLSTPRLASPARGLGTVLRDGARADRDLRPEPALVPGRLPGLRVAPVRNHPGPGTLRPIQAARQAQERHLAPASQEILETNSQPPKPASPPRHNGTVAPRKTREFSGGTRIADCGSLDVIDRFRSVRFSSMRTKLRWRGDSVALS